MEENEEKRPIGGLMLTKAELEEAVGYYVTAGGFGSLWFRMQSRDIGENLIAAYWYKIKKQEENESKKI